jgi:hypothetical protein
MNDATVRRVVRGKIADGSLPRDRIGAVSVAYGTEEVCGACAASVSPGEVLYKLTRAGSERLVFHGECFVIWRDERNRMSAGPAVLD